MNGSRMLRNLVALAVTLSAGACGSAARGAATAAPTSDSNAEIEALYRQRVESARTRFTEADVHFMNGMIGHHAQALVMASLVPERSSSRSIQTLAARIINAQRDEIALMQQWLRDRGQPVPELHGTGADLRVHHGPGHQHHHAMPGMLTEAQLAELAAAEGAEFDRLFLRSMIQHHRGAVVMVRELFATDGAGQDEEAFRFASDAQVDQSTEIARMERMLEALTR